MIEQTNEPGLLMWQTSQQDKVYQIVVTSALSNVKQN